MEQLEVWATRAGVDILVRGREPIRGRGLRRGRFCRPRGAPPFWSTPQAVFTRVNLMSELDKIRRIVAREIEGAPHEVLLVLDATVGQNGLVQAREFLQAAGVTGVVLTKLDGTAKGGIAVAIAHDLKLPIGTWVGEASTTSFRFLLTKVNELAEEKW